MSSPIPTPASRFLARLFAWLGLALALAPPPVPTARAQEAGTSSVVSALYVRTDTDRTTIITPRLRLTGAVADETQLSLVYTVDVWTSASVDIRTSASPAVTEQRDEIDVGLTHGLGDLSLRGSYRYSTEYDYESHGGSAGATYELAQKNASVALDVTAMSDRVGRVGDPDSYKPASQLGGRVSFTQILDAKTLAQLSYELIRQQGFLSSPYRYIPIAYDDEPRFVGRSRCVEPLATCIPEINPDERTRHAAALRARRSLSSLFSTGASYRFYIDDWGLQSHTARADLAWRPDERWLLALAYRFYDQSAASHYKPFYSETPEQSHYTNDKELSPMTAHRLGLEIDRVFELDDQGSRLNATLLGGPSYYQYHNFPRLQEITAFDITLSVGAHL